MNVIAQRLQRMNTARSKVNSRVPTKTVAQAKRPRREPLQRPPRNRLCRAGGGAPMRGRAQRAGDGSKFAAATGVGETLAGDFHHLVLFTHHLTQIKILHRVM